MSIPWNKGLTKETDERVRLMGEEIKRTHPKLSGENNSQWKGGVSKNKEHRRKTNRILMRKKREQEPEKTAKIDKYYYLKNREKRLEKKKEYYQKYKEREIAKGKVKNALKNGLLEKGQCEICGSTKNLNAHHEDYNKPLDVNWFCKRHHMRKHSKYKY